MENDTRGITVGGEALEEYLERKEGEEKDKTVVQLYKDQKAAPARQPLSVRLKYRQRAERAGKVKHLTAKEIEMDYKDPNEYKTNQQKVIALLLKEQKPLTFMDIGMAINADKNSLSAVLSEMCRGLESCGVYVKDAGEKGVTYKITDPDILGKTVEEVDEMIKATRRKNGKKKPKAKADDDIAPGAPAPAPAPEQPKPDIFGLVDEIAEALRMMPEGVTVEVSVKVTGAPRMPLKYD